MKPVDPYELGACADEEVRGFIVSPQDILDRMNEVKTEADRLNNIVNTDQRVGPEFQMAWRDWYENTWNKFYADHTGALGWFSRLTASVLDEADRHMDKVVEWRALLEKVVGKLAGPSPTPTGGAPIPWKPVLYAGAAIAGLVAVGYVLKQVSDLRRG